LRIEVGAQTHVGRARQNNEDSYQIEESLNLYVLSDGIGGEEQGEVASAMAVETVVGHCLEAENHHAAALFIEPRPDVSERTNRLASAATLANRKIFDSAASDPQRRRMGATVVAAWLQGERVSLVHVGDSRAYLLRGRSLEQLTADHSLVAEQVRRGVLTPQEAETSQLQSVLIRALGSEARVEVDVDEHILLEGDTLLLCSDGLTRMVSDPEIASTLMTVESAQAAAERLVDLANEYGGLDNVTVIVVRALPNSGGMLQRLRRRWSMRSHPAQNGQSSGDA
jgi:serine/threonine protein phosphatase PrpC